MSKFHSNKKDPFWLVRGGPTLSLARACAEYGVTQGQCREANLIFFYQPQVGDSYAVVKAWEVAALGERLAQETKERRKKELVDRLRKEDLERKRMRACQEQEGRAATKNRISEEMRALVSLQAKMVGASEVPDSVAGIQVNRTTAKKDWFLYDEDLQSLLSTKVGRSKSYNLEEVIAKALSKYSKPCLEGKLLNRQTWALEGTIHPTLLQYVSYSNGAATMNWRLEPKDSFQEARTQTIAQLRQDIQASQDQLEQAQQDLNAKKRGLKSFVAVTAPVALCGETNDENEAPPTNDSSRKRVKVQK